MNGDVFRFQRPAVDTSFFRSVSPSGGDPFTVGLQNGATMREIQQQNALRGWADQHGANALRGDTVAINALAAIDPERASTLLSAHQTRDLEGQRFAAEQAEAQQLELNEADQRLMRAASQAWEAQDPEAWTAIFESQRLPVPPMEAFPSMAAAAGLDREWFTQPDPEIREDQNGVARYVGGDTHGQPVFSGVETAEPQIITGAQVAEMYPGAQVEDPAALFTIEGGTLSPISGTGAPEALERETVIMGDRLLDRGTGEVIADYTQPDPTAELERRRLELQVEQLENPPPADEYQRYAAEENAAGRVPMTRIEYEQAIDPPRGTTTRVRPDGTVEIVEGPTGAEAGRIDPASVQSMIGTIDGILNDPAMGWSTGMWSWTQALPGTPMRRFGARARQLEGQAFLQAFESLKGGGAITETEGLKATQAIGRLDTAQSEADYRDALSELRGILTTAQLRLSGGSSADVSADPALTPPASIPNDMDDDELVRFYMQGGTR
ncbi:hypothetical protein [Rubellimicrobium roseum]|uniref:Uncharacterized protein n=1 Tax=Rubellimicrobium roseum TaxID=687525 RepID=A0A5C4NM10_9RHOB|nr:hypothetical protein [Rubellimicrobium roseum]TNC74156.1 hypothetical protein FHG71_02890 [Rubellimicrobium roseum]